MSEVLEYIENQEELFDIPSFIGTSQEGNHNLEEWVGE